jgi:hypothetical protein
MASRPSIAYALALALGACGSADLTGSQGKPPTVLVTNATCEAGHCTTLEIRAFVWKFTVPQSPAGSRVLGEAPPGQTCLPFPVSWPLRIIGTDQSGHVDTTTITWTADDTSSIYLIGVDSQAYHGGAADGSLPYDGLVPGSLGETPNFVASDAPGWSVTFPSAPSEVSDLASAAACTT